MQVLLMDDDKGAPGELQRALQRAGHEVMEMPAPAGAELQEWIVQHHPCLLMMKLDTLRAPLLQQLHNVLEAVPLPVVMFVKRSDPVMTNNAIMAGVSAYIIDGMHSHRLQPVMELAMARFNNCQALHGELKKAQGELAERKLIERAKGLVMQQLGLTEEQAFVAIRKRAMDQNLRLAQVAQAIITAADLLGTH